MSKSVLYTSSPLLASKTPVWRSKFIVAAIALGFVGLAGRAAYIQVFGNAFFQRQGEVRFARTLELPANRGRILDRNGLILASSVVAQSIWAIPEDIDRDKDKLQQLARLLSMPLAELNKKIEDEDKTFVWLKRQVDESVAQQIAELGIKGVYQRREYKRKYPEGEAAAHVVGFTNVENIGQEGVELAFDKELAGRPGSRRVIKDRLGRVVEDVGEQVPPVDGRDLQLSIDSKVQFFAVAMALQAGRVTPQTLIETGPGRYSMAGFTIRDTHDYGTLTVEGVIQKSSNVGALKIAQKMTPHEMWDTFTLLGYGQKPQLQFPGAVTGRLRPVEDLAPGRAGHDGLWLRPVGIAVPDGTVVHRVRARRPGHSRPPSSRPATRPVGTPVFSARNAAAVRKMLQMAAGPGGTGQRAQTIGYSVGGKSGTAHKQVGKGYATQQVPLLVHRHGADRQAPHRRGGDDRRAQSKGQVLRWRSGRAGVQRDGAAGPAPDGRDSPTWRSSHRSWSKPWRSPF
jgi:cell division protein FtsI/penicillin-binding protein 2